MPMYTSHNSIWYMVYLVWGGIFSLRCSPAMLKHAIHNCHSVSVKMNSGMQLLTNVIICDQIWKSQSFKAMSCNIHTYRNFSHVFIAILCTLVRNLFPVLPLLFDQYPHKKKPKIPSVIHMFYLITQEQTFPLRLRKSFIHWTWNL